MDVTSVLTPINARDKHFSSRGRVFNVIIVNISLYDRGKIFLECFFRVHDVFCIYIYLLYFGMKHNRLDMLEGEGVFL